MVCDCGTPWTFLLPFFHIFLVFLNIFIDFIFSALWMLMISNFLYEGALQDYCLPLLVEDVASHTVPGFILLTDAWVDTMGIILGEQNDPLLLVYNARPYPAGT